MKCSSFLLNAFSDITKKSRDKTFCTDQIYGDAGLWVESYRLIVLFRSPPELKQAGILDQNILAALYSSDYFVVAHRLARGTWSGLGATRDRMVRREISKIHQLAI